MKLRESVQRYSVEKHGSEYIDYSSPAIICPECQGTNVREIGDEETGRNGDYLCKDRGCEFDTCISSELTGFGKFINKLTKVMAGIFFVSAFVCFIAGIIYLLYLDHTYGNGNVPDDLMRTGFAIAIGGPLLLTIFAGIVHVIYEKI